MSKSRWPLPFAKYSGAGNDFIILDARQEEPAGDPSALAKALCRRGRSVGADGLIVESHVAPVKGIGDDPKQAVTPEVLYKLIKDARAIHAMQKEHVAHIVANA